MYVQASPCLIYLTELMLIPSSPYMPLGKKDAHQQMHAAFCLCAHLDVDILYSQLTIAITELKIINTIEPLCDSYISKTLGGSHNCGIMI